MKDISIDAFESDGTDGYTCGTMVFHLTIDGKNCGKFLSIGDAMESAGIKRPSHLPARLPRTAPAFKDEVWEGDERIITVDGTPIGGTLSKHEAAAIQRWLNGNFKYVLDKIHVGIQDP